MNENFDIFDEFAMSYDMNEDMIAYKYNHSYRTVHQAEEIARSLNLDDEDKELASFIALVHDIARFRQWTEFKTYDDRKSFDHGDEGVKILFEEDEIKKYQVNEKDYDIIKKAVKFHNKFSVDKNELSDRELLHCNIIRDADKLDIIYAFSTHRLLELSTDDSLISDKVKESFMNHKLVNKEDVVSNNDKIIMELALVYDLNYDYSIKRVLDENYLNKMIDSLNNKELFIPYLNELNEYMKGRIENAR